jgi:hypothetical protein
VVDRTLYAISTKGLASLKKCHWVSHKNVKLVAKEQSPKPAFQLPSTHLRRSHRLRRPSAADESDYDTSSPDDDASSLVAASSTATAQRGNANAASLQAAAARKRQRQLSK